MLEFLCVKVVPSSTIHPLPQQFNGRLCSVLLFLRHIQIINEDNNLAFPFFWPIEALPPSRAHFAVDQSLHLVCRGLPGEGSGQEGVGLVIVVYSHLVRHIYGFSCSCWTDEQNMQVVFYVLVQEVIETDAIICWDDEVVVADFFRSHKRWLGLGPVLPDHLLLVVEHVIEMAFIREFGTENNW